MMLTARNIHKYYRNPGNGAKEVHVLNGINLDVQKGEIVAVVGPSGAGKSTLLHIMGGLEKPSQGEMIFDGQNIYRLDDKRRAKMRNERIGFIFQFYHLLPEFSALENVMLPVMVKNSSRLTSEMRRLGLDFLAQVGMEKRAAHKPNELSGGEQQRIAIARALVNQPDVLFCDEPTGNLDSENGTEVIKLLMHLNETNGQTLIIVTHDEEIAGRTGRVVYLRDGEIQAPQNPRTLDPQKDKVGALGDRGTGEH